MNRLASRRSLIAVSFSLFIILGVSTGVTGVVWPSLRSDFSRPLADLGVLLAVGTGGYFLAGLTAGWLTRRLGIGRVLIVVLALGSGCLGGYVLVQSWLLLLACSVGVGFAGGTIDSLMNAYVALRHDTRMMNLLHAFFGIGATTAPLLVTVVLSGGLSWKVSYLVVVGAELALLVAVIRMRSRWPDSAALVPPGEGHHRLGGSVIGLLGMFFLYVGIEITAGQWSFSVLTEGRRIGEFAAGIWVALFWGGLTGGRLALGVIGDRYPPRRLLLVSMAGSVAGSGLFWLDPLGLGVVGLPLLGFSLAGIFPILVALTPGWVGEERAETVIGFQIAAAAAGTALMPWVAGRIIAAGGLESLGPYLVVLCLAMAGLNWLVGVVVRSQTGTEHSRSAATRSTRDTNSSQS